MSHTDDYLRVAVAYEDEGYDIQYCRDDISDAAATERTEKYVTYAREEDAGATESGLLPFDQYRANIRLFNAATIVNLPFEEKDYRLLFSLDARGQKHLRGIVREMYRKAYEKPPAPFR